MVNEAITFIMHIHICFCWFF